MAGTDFIRVSKSMILNLLKVERFVPVLGGRIEAVLKNGERADPISKHMVLNRLEIKNLGRGKLAYAAVSTVAGQHPPPPHKPQKLVNKPCFRLLCARRQSGNRWTANCIFSGVK
mgnify:CR=1 FL=1